jgi:hypothetical protein
MAGCLAERKPNKLLFQMMSIIGGFVNNGAGSTYMHVLLSVCKQFTHSGNAGRSPHVLSLVTRLT